jgi:hypothetical protein
LRLLLAKVTVKIRMHDQKLLRLAQTSSVESMFDKYFAALLASHILIEG